MVNHNDPLVYPGSMAKKPTHIKKIYPNTICITRRMYPQDIPDRTLSTCVKCVKILIPTSVFSYSNCLMKLIYK